MSSSMTPDKTVASQCHDFLTDWVSKMTDKNKKEMEPFLDKVPAELRLKIWGYLSGNDTIHVRAIQGYKYEKPKLHLTACEGVSSFDTTGENDQQLATPRYSRCKCPEGSLCGKGIKDSGILGLLRTSKVVEAEVIEVLYMNKTFQFDYVSGLIQLQKALPEAHFTAIRSIQLTVSCSRPFDISAMGRSQQDLQTTFKALKGLPNLRRLELYMLNLDREIACASIQPRRPLLTPLVCTAVILWVKEEIAGELEILYPLWYGDRHGTVTKAIDDRAVLLMSYQLGQDPSRGDAKWKITAWDNLPKEFWTRLDAGSLKCDIQRD